MSAPWQLYDVSVDGYGTSVMTGPSRGSVLAERWRSDAFGHLTFGAFLKICRVRVRAEPLADDGYGYVRSNYGLDLKVGQRVVVCNGRGFWDREGRVAYPNSISTASVSVVLDASKRAGRFHPSEVRPLSPLPRHRPGLSIAAR